MQKDKTVTVAFSIPQSMLDELDQIKSTSKGIYRSRSHVLSVVFQQWKQCKNSPKKSPKLEAV